MAEPAETRINADIELTAEYANNSFFEATVWDLKIIFGEFSGRNNSVNWHTSITLPWAQAKILAYYLAVNLAIHEFNQGPIRVPSGVLPPKPPSLPDSETNNPAAQAVYEYVTKLHEKFIEGLGKLPSA